MPDMPAQRFNINQASKMCGLSPSVLRIWELRYKWPKPIRKQNGYRAYDEDTIKELKRIAELVVNGKSIGELVEDGKIIHKELPPAPVSRKIEIDFFQVPLPKTSEGRHLRQRLESAIRNADMGQVALIKSLALRLRPDERELAMTRVMQLFRQTQISDK